MLAFNAEQLLTVLFISPEPVCVSRQCALDQFQETHLDRPGRSKQIVGRPAADRLLTTAKQIASVPARAEWLWSVPARAIGRGARQAAPSQALAEEERSGDLGGFLNMCAACPFRGGRVVALDCIEDLPHAGGAGYRAVDGREGHDAQP